MTKVLSVAIISLNQEQNFSSNLANKTWRQMEKCSCVSGEKKRNVCDVKHITISKHNTPCSRQISFQAFRFEVMPGKLE